MSATSPVRLSIVTVCRNDLANVQRTIESLGRQAKRDGWEHVLIDGASSDGTVDWYQSAEFDFPHRVVSEPDNGFYDAMNKSLSIVEGDYVVFMNAGDRYADDGAIGRALDKIESDPAWGYCRARVVDSSGRRTRLQAQVGSIPYSRIRHLLGLSTICHQAVVIRVDFLRELDGFDLRMGSASDHHVLVKAGARVPPVTWPEADVDFLVGGITSRRVFGHVWDRHRARVDALNLNPVVASLDAAWTALQILRIGVRKTLKPIFGPLFRATYVKEPGSEAFRLGLLGSNQARAQRVEAKRARRRTP